MNYNPIVLGCNAAPFAVNLSDTVRCVYNNYSFFKWQKSNVGGTIWADMTGPGTSGTGSPVLVGGQYQYVTNLPPFLATPADSGTYYRVIVGTTAANLTGNCAFNDGSSTMVKVINCGIVLNGNFIQFKGALNNNKTYLNWATSGEANLLFYEIEKSTDGINFEKIARMDAKNTAEAFYAFNDIDIINGTVYYRLKMINENNLFKYSNIILLSTSLSFDVKNIQNPFTDKINADVIVPADGPLSLQLFNDEGQLIKSFSKNVRKGYNKVLMDNLGVISNGIYFISATFNNNSLKRKLIKN